MVSIDLLVEFPIGFERLGVEIRPRRILMVLRLIGEHTVKVVEAVYHAQKLQDHQ